MKDLEFNKIAAAVLVAGLIAMIAGKVTDVLYHPITSPEKRGFEVEVIEATEGNGAADQAQEEELKIGQLMAKADAANGEKISKKCTACHSFEQGGANKVGPNLYGVLNNPRGAHPGFNYSDAMKAAGGVWDYQHLAAFLHNPKKGVPGTIMGFAGLKKPQDVADMIAYLRQQGDAGAALPPAE